MDNLSHNNMTGQGPATGPETNSEIWVQLEEETRNTNLVILETVQELKNEMAYLREDNVRLTMEQEKISRISVYWIPTLNIHEC